MNKEIKLCKDCRYFQRQPYPYSIINPPRCTKTTDVVTGEPALSCALHRYGECGREAKFFEERQPFWKRLFE